MSFSPLTASVVLSERAASEGGCSGTAGPWSAGGAPEPRSAAAGGAVVHRPGFLWSSVKRSATVFIMELHWKKPLHTYKRKVRRELS